jgi:hypothetical protein
VVGAAHDGGGPFGRLAYDAVALPAIVDDLCDGTARRKNEEEH